MRILNAFFGEYEARYKNILGIIYPAENSTGFPERNLSVNWSKAIETIFPESDNEIVSWFEYQFGENNNEHLDALIWNKTIKDLFLVESKRFSSPESKMKETFEDIVRIYKLYDEIIIKSRLDKDFVDHCYGVILADVWPKKSGRGKKKEIFDSFCSPGIDFLTLLKDSIDEESREKLKQLPMNPQYYASDLFKKLSQDEDYGLVSLVWKIK